MHELKIILELAAGSVCYVLSAEVTHGNVPIALGEKRYAMTAYTSASFFQFAERGFQPVGKWSSEAERQAYGNMVFEEGVLRLPVVY